MIDPDALLDIEMLIIGHPSLLATPPLLNTSSKERSAYLHTRTIIGHRHATHCQTVFRFYTLNKNDQCIFEGLIQVRKRNHAGAYDLEGGGGGGGGVGRGCLQAHVCVCVCVCVCGRRRSLVVQ